MFNIYGLTGLLVPLGICVILPAIVVWLITRKKTNETNKRTEILLAALEKNVSIDTDAITKMMAETSTKKSIKRELLHRLLIGCVLAFAGLAVIVQDVLKLLNGNNDYDYDILTGCIICLAIGIAFIINFFIGRRFLAKEIETEEMNMCKTE